MLKWKGHLDISEKQSGQQFMVHYSFGVFSTERVDEIQLYTARMVAKKEVAEENALPNGTMVKNT